MPAKIFLQQTGKTGAHFIDITGSYKEKIRYNDISEER